MHDLVKKFVVVENLNFKQMMGDVIAQLHNNTTIPRQFASLFFRLYATL